MRSQSRTVEIRWVTTIVVSVPSSLLRVSTMRASVAVSRLRGRLVEDEHGRSNVEGAGEADPLSLAAGEADAAFADPGLDSVRELARRRRRVGRAGSPRRRLRRRSRRRASRARRSRGACRRRGRRPAGRSRSIAASLRGSSATGVPSIVTVPDFGREEAEDDVEEGALAGSGRSDDARPIRRPRS